ncbi:MAG: ATP-binding cassette domain-containing protein [Bacteroidaceae bacterium]
MQTTIQIKGGVARDASVRMAAPIEFELRAGEQLAIVGPNGAGKTLLVDTLLGKYPLCEGEVRYDFGPDASPMCCENVKYIAFRDTYGSADANYYYQQRWNAHDQDEVPEVARLLGPLPAGTWRDDLFDLFGLGEMLPKKVIALSSGELRKFQLAKALLAAPRVLVMDNPFIGLDAQARLLLHNLLTRLTQLGRVQLVLVQSKLDELPDFVTHVYPIYNKVCGAKQTRTEYLVSYVPPTDELEVRQRQQRVLSLPEKKAVPEADEVVRLNHVSIRYDGRTILQPLDWVVRRGERWALCGANGSGKSTLLSLVCADNPQSYACDIALFGRKRGTGESIWEIKRHIGYVSPEMHRSYLKNLPAVEIVASGLHDSIGLYRRMRPEQREACEWWMETFGIADLKDRSFLSLSSGEQRLTLLARAFVKDPELLILDEPFHGLDTNNRRVARAVIEAFCHRADKTLVMVTHCRDELPDCVDRVLEL